MCLHHPERIAPFPETTYEWLASDLLYISGEERRAALDREIAFWRALRDDAPLKITDGVAFFPLRLAP
jgi:hypothetical protein